MSTAPTTQPRNGHQATTVPVLTGPTVTTHPKTTTGKVIGGPPLPIQFHDSIHKYFFESARTTLKQESTPEDERHVEETARAIAAQSKRKHYDPINDPDDQKTEAQNKLNEQQRARIDEQIQHAGRDGRAEKRKKAGLPPAEKPPIPLPIMLLAAFLIATSLSPTFFDYFFFTVPDAPLRWLYAAIAGALIGFLISWAGLRHVDLKGGKSEPRMLNGFLAGALLMAVALGGIRFAHATTSTAKWFAAALTAMEIAVFIILEFLAQGFRASFREYQERADEHSKADRYIAAAIEHHEDLLRQRAAKQAEIDNHYEYVEWRNLCCDNIDEIKEAAARTAVSAWRDGCALTRAETILP
jgi:hypothetical protein